MAIIDYATDVDPDAVPDLPPDLPGRPLAEIRAALAGHALGGDPADLDRGLAAGRALIAALPGGAPAYADVRRLRELADACPEFADLLDVAADAAGTALAEAGGRLWIELSLHRALLGWTDAERAAARMVFACACARPEQGCAEWLAASLRRVAAARVAAQLCDELADSERVWLRALGDRYGSLRYRCAPRTALRSRGLADLLRSDPVCRAAVQSRVERWLAAGGWTEELGAELEAAVVHVRTPARLA